MMEAIIDGWVDEECNGGEVFSLWTAGSCE